MARMIDGRNTLGMDQTTLNPEFSDQVRLNETSGHTLICLLDFQKPLGRGAFCAFIMLLVRMKENRQGPVSFPDFFCRRSVGKVED
jgi:hypothetical protein